ncbi:MAG: DUF616 domain-containing protein [Anaerolineales bacterium]|nr:DUF616 domain-containing protein [Anaerolineales bacterium]
MDNIVVFTGVFGRPDVFLEPRVPLDGVEAICFTDLDFVGESAYRMIKLNLDSLSPPKRNRRVKIWREEIFDCFDYSLYLDSNVELLVDPRELVSFLEPGSDIAVFRHPDRDCAYQEGRVCLQAGLADPRVMRRQLTEYRAEGFPPKFGLWACTVVLRNHTPRMEEFNRRWWSEVERHSHRDQVSFPYVVWETGMQVSEFPGSLRRNELISWRPWDSDSGWFRVREKKAKEVCNV